MPRATISSGDLTLMTLFRITPIDHAITTIGTWTVPESDFPEDVHLTIDAAGNYILATDSASDGGEDLQLFVVPPTTVNAKLTPLTLTGDDRPNSTGGITLDAHGNYVDVDWFDDTIVTIAPVGSHDPPFSTTPREYCPIRRASHSMPQATTSSSLGRWHQMMPFIP